MAAMLPIISGMYSTPAFADDPALNIQSGNNMRRQMSWQPAIKDLSKEHRCIAIDFRGWGKSSRDVRNYDLDTLTRDVVAVIHELAWPKQGMTHAIRSALAAEARSPGQWKGHGQ